MLKLRRVAVALFAVATVGALIGVGAEQIAFRGEAREDEAVFTRENSQAEPPSHGDPEAARIVRRATDGLPPYGDAAPQPLAADYLGPSAPVAAAWFETDDGPDAVLTFYRKKILAQGIPVLEDRTSASSGYVGYKNPRTGEVHLVTAVAEGRHTRVFVSNANVEALRTGATALPDGFPHPTGIESPLVMTFRREGEIESSVVATVAGASLDALVTFYRQAFSAEGWTLDDVKTSDRGATLEAHREGARVFTQLRGTDGDAVELYARWVTQT